VIVASSPRAPSRPREPRLDPSTDVGALGTVGRVEQTLALAIPDVDVGARFVESTNLLGVDAARSDVAIARHVRERRDRSFAASPITHDRGRRGT